MALTYSEHGKLGSHAPDFKLPATDGRTYQLSDFKEAGQNAKALVVAFICNHCRYVIATQKRINQLAREYLPLGVQWAAINSNDAEAYPDDNFEAMKVRAQEQGYVFPYLRDESQDVARAYGAVCTPEFYAYALVNGQWILKYKGRLDDNWKDETAVTHQDLKEALDAILAGKDPNVDQKPSMGCSLKWKA